MKALLMFKDRSFEASRRYCFDSDTLTKDLELERILKDMSDGDDIIYNVCTVALLNPLTDVSEIRYRQENLHDALANPALVRKFYAIIIETFKRRKSLRFWLSGEWNITNAYSSAVDLLKLFTEMLMELRTAADIALPSFSSEGFVNLISMIRRELSDDYFAEVRAHLDELKSKDGTLISAAFGSYLQGVNYVLRRKERKGFRLRWQLSPSFSVSDRDELGMADLGSRHDRASSGVSIALAKAAEHLESFFDMLRCELAFYVGCLNLADKLRGINMPVCIPKISPISSNNREWSELYSVSLALEKGSGIVGNSLEAFDKLLYIVTGANQGGKSTFLKSLGQAQLMAQCGMPVGAKSFTVPVRSGVYSHFIKEEDTAMKSGKLDEELSRMNKIVNQLSSGALVLFNESFASTNERDGSEIIRQITKSFVENGIEVFSITHLFTYAAAFKGDPKAQYLRAERLDSSERTFKIVPGEPLETAFGADLYNKIFTKAG